jgi:hypothetical protein
MTQSDPAALDVRPPLLPEALPTVTELPLPLPGEIVVDPLTPPPPAVIEVEFDEEPEPPSCRVTTRQGLSLVMVAPFGPEVTAVLAASAGAAAARNPSSSGRVA